MTRTDRSDYITRTVTVNDYKVITIDSEDTAKVFYMQLPEISPKATKAYIEDRLPPRTTLVKYSIASTREEMRRMRIIDFYDKSEDIPAKERLDVDVKSVEE